MWACTHVCARVCVQDQREKLVSELTRLVRSPGLIKAIPNVAQIITELITMDNCNSCSTV